MLGTATCVLQLGWLHTLELPMVFEWIAKFCARWNCAQLHVICSPGQSWLHSGVLLGGARCVQMGQLAPKAPGSPPVSPSYTLLLSTSTPNTDTDSDTDINTVASHPPKGHILSRLYHICSTGTFKCDPCEETFIWKDESWILFRRFSPISPLNTDCIIV